MITNGILKDALKKHWELSGRTVAILFGEFHHRVLDDIQRELLIPNCIHRLLECPPFNGFQEVVKFFSRGQGIPSPAESALTDTIGGQAFSISSIFDQGKPKFRLNISKNNVL